MQVWLADFRDGDFKVLDEQESAGESWEDDIFSSKTDPDSMHSPANMQRPIGNLFGKNKKSLELWRLVKKYTRMCGDQHLSKLSMAGNIICPTLMTVAIILTYTYFAPKTRTSTLTRIMRQSSGISVELASKGFIVIAEANISAVLSMNILPNLALCEVLTHPSIMECQSDLIAHFSRRCKPCFMLVNF